MWTILGVKKPSQISIKPQAIARENQSHLNRCTDYLSWAEIFDYFPKNGFENLCYVEKKIVFLKQYPIKIGHLF